MAKLATHPFIIDECKQIDIKNLKDWGYLRNPGKKEFDLRWTIGTQVSEIGACLINNREIGFLILSYIIDEAPVKYKIRLLNKPSNLGKGVLWYFICPVTGEVCRKLYLGTKYFVHREALQGGYYSKQTRSKKYRDIVRVFGAGFKADDLYDEIYSKHFRRFYNGKPTKRFLKIIKELRRLEGDKFNLRNCL